MPGLKNKKPPLKKEIKKGVAKKTARTSVAQKSAKAVVKKTAVSKTAAAHKNIKKLVKKSSVKTAVNSKSKDLSSQKSTSKVVKEVVKKKNVSSQKLPPVTKKIDAKSIQSKQTVSSQSQKKLPTAVEKNNSNIVKKPLAKNKKTVIIGAPSTMNNKKVVKKVQSNKNEKLDKETSPTVVQSHVAPIANFASAVDLTTEIVDPGFLDNGDVFDEADHAQWQQLREQADIHSRAMQLNKPETHPDFNGFECVECGEEIPLPRLKMHKVRCVECQNDLEKDRQRVQRSTYHPKGGLSSGWDE